MLVTGAGTNGNLAQARALGASGVVVKPFATADLVAAVEAALSEAVTPVARRGRSVLLVEDDEDLAALVTETIGRAVNDVPRRSTHSTIESAETARRRAAPGRSPCSTTTFRTGAGSTCSSGSATPSTRDLPVLMMTGEGSERVAVEAFRRGASDYVVKGEGTLARTRNARSRAAGRHDDALPRSRRPPRRRDRRRLRLARVAQKVEVVGGRSRRRGDRCASLDETNPDVALVDFRMPKLCGTELVERMREDGAHDTKVVVYTAEAGDHLAVRRHPARAAPAIVLKEAPLDDIMRARRGGGRRAQLRRRDAGRHGPS